MITWVQPCLLAGFSKSKQPFNVHQNKQWTPACPWCNSVWGPEASFKIRAAINVHQNNQWTPALPMSATFRKFFILKFEMKNICNTAEEITSWKVTI